MLAKLRQRVAILGPNVSSEKQMEHQKRRETALQQVRSATWEMQSVDEMVQLIYALKTGLDTMGISYHDCGINLVDTSGPTPVAHQFYAEEKVWRTAEKHEMDVILRLWRAEGPTYRRDLATDDVHGEQDHINEEFGTSIRSVVDVPFFRGTLAINSTKPDAFSERGLSHFFQ